MLPEKILLQSSKSDSDQLFRAAHELWLREVQLSQVRPLIELLASRRGATLDATQKATLKSVRKFGAILRGAFELFDKDHSPPKDLAEFVTAFGKVNDAIEANQLEAVAEAATRLQRSLEHFNEGTPRFELQPGGAKSFAHHLEDQLPEIRKLASKEEVPTPEFHELRKMLKTFLNYFQVSEALHPDQDSAAVYAYLFRLNEDLGLLHDSMVNKSLSGQLDYESSKLTIPEELRRRVMDFVARVRIER